MFPPIASEVQTGLAATPAVNAMIEMPIDIAKQRTTHLAMRTSAVISAATDPLSATALSRTKADGCMPRAIDGASPAFQRRCAHEISSESSWSTRKAQLEL
jgi:hypothetical protein